jgi:hypothetical protein
MKYLIAGLICLAGVTGMAVPDTIVRVGQIELAIPVPAGFTPVVPEMKAVNQLLDAMTYGDNQRLAHYIPESDASLALNNEIPEMARSFSVQTPKKIANQPATKADFAQLAKDLVKYNTEIIQKLEKETPGYLKQANTKLKEIDPDLNFQNMSFAPLPPHQQDERVLAYSMFMTTQTAAGPVRIACTANILHVKAKLLFVYAYAPEKEMAWTRDTSKQWVAGILASNPSTPDIAKLEQSGPSLLRTPGGRIARSAIIGAVVGGIFGLVQMLRKKKASTTSTT